MFDDIRAETIKLVRRPAIWTLLGVALALSLTFTYLVPYAGYAGGTGGPTRRTAVSPPCCPTNSSATRSAACRFSWAR